MKSFGKIIFCLFIFGPSLLVFFSNLFFSEDESINPNDYARITDVEYKAVVVDEPNSQGKVIITERLTFDVHAASRSNPFWELWRDLCEDWVDGVHVEYKVNSVKQILDDGTEIIYEESPKLYWDDSDYLKSNSRYGPGKWYHSKGPYNEDTADYECVFFYIDGVYRETMVFEIEYEMYNASLRYNDCSDLYLSMYSEDTINYLNSFKAEILIPNKNMPAQGNYIVTTYGTNANSFPVEESSKANPGYYTFSFELDEDDLNFRPYNEYIEFDLVSFGSDKHKFTKYASVNDYYFDDVLDEILDEQEAYKNTPGKFRIIKIVTLICSIIASIFLLIYSSRAIIRIKLKHIFYTPTIDFEFYREIPSDLDPNFASKLVFSKHKPLKDDSGIFSAILLSLARKEYITLTESGGDDVLITLNRLMYQTPIHMTMPNMGIANNTYSTFNNFNTQRSSVAITPTPTQYRTDTNINSTYPNNNNINIYTNNAPMSTDDMGFGDIGFSEPIRMGFDDNQYTNTVDTDYHNTTDASYNSVYTNGYQNFAYTNEAGEPLHRSAYVQPFGSKEYEPLTVSEQHYYNLLLRHAPGRNIYMSAFQSSVAEDYENTDTFVRNIENAVVNVGVNGGYFQKADYMEPRKQLKSKSTALCVFGILFAIIVNIISYHTRMDFAFGGFFIFGISCIIGSIYLKKQSRKYILLTQYGEDEYEKWRGLYDFLNSNTLISERTMIELPLWEKYLVYATAFGLSEKIIKAISIRCPEASTSPILNNNYCRSGRIHRSGRSFHRSVRHGSSVHRSGGGFGYGGGGRGGGGGGGGH